MTGQQGKGESKSSPRIITATEKQRQALEMRKAGKSFDIIAENLGYRDRSGAYRAIARALRKTIQQPAEEVRTLEVERLDAMLQAMWTQAKSGNQGAIDRVLRIMERRAKLLGLDAPTKSEIRISELDAAIEQGLAQLAGAGEAGPAPTPSTA